MLSFSDARTDSGFGKSLLVKEEIEKLSKTIQEASVAYGVDEENEEDSSTSGLEPENEDTLLDFINDAAMDEDLMLHHSDSEDSSSTED